MSDFVYMIKFDAKARATIYMCKRGGRCVTFNYFLFEFSVFCVYLDIFMRKHESVSLGPWRDKKYIYFQT